MREDEKKEAVEILNLELLVLHYHMFGEEVAILTTLTCESSTWGTGVSKEHATPWSCQCPYIKECPLCNVSGFNAVLLL